MPEDRALTGQPMGERIARIETELTGLMTGVRDVHRTLARMEDRWDRDRWTRQEHIEFVEREYLPFKRWTEEQFQQATTRSLRLLWTLVATTGAGFLTVIIWGVSVLNHRP